MAYGNYTGKLIDITRFPRRWEDLRYADCSPAQTLDLYLPAEGDGPFPLIALVHGGGWCSGSKRGTTMECVFRCLSQGFALASIEYRFATDAPLPAMVHDVKAAIRYLRAHASELRLAADRIVMWGNSSGGHVANMVAATGSHPGLVDDLALGNAEQSSAVQGLISWYAPVDMLQLDLCDALPPDENIRWLEPGAFDDATDTGLPTMQAIAIGCIPRFNPNAALAASPIEYVDTTFPPALFQHGCADPIIPFTQSAAMWKRVCDVCGPNRAKLELFDGATHGDPRIKAPDNIDRCLDFVRRIVAGKTNTGE